MKSHWLSLDRYRALVATAHRPELEQSSLRVLIAGIVMVYLFWYASRDGAVSPSEGVVLHVSIFFFVFSLALMLRVLMTARPSIARRYLGMRRAAGHGRMRLSVTATLQGSIGANGPR